MLTGLMAVMLLIVILVLLLPKHFTTSKNKPRKYIVHLPDEETRLRQALQDGTDLSTFAQVEVKDNVAVITATRRIEMRCWQGELILHQFGTRGGMGIEIRVPWYSCAEGLAGLQLIHLEKGDKI